MNTTKTHVISKSRRRFFRIVLLSALLLAGLLLVELSARIKFAESRLETSHFSELTHDPVLGWKGIPGYRGKGFWRAGGVEIAINADGFRDDDWSKKIAQAKKDKAKKILFLGDSQLYGWAIHKRDRVTEQLTHEYRLAGIPVEVFNAGLPGFGTGQQYRSLEVLAPRIDPDVVVCNFCANDVGDSALPYDPVFPHRIYKPFYDLEGNLILNETVPKRFSLRIKDTPLALFRMRFIIDRVTESFEDRRYRQMGIPENRTVPDPPMEPLPWGERVSALNMGYMFMRDEYEDLYQRNKSRNFALIHKMKAFSEHRGARFVFVLNHLIFEPLHPHETELREKLEQEGVEVFFQREFQEPYKHWCYVNGDGHVNFLYNYLYAIHLFNRIENQDRTPDFSRAAWSDSVPSTLHLGDPAIEPWLFGRWNPEDAKGRWLGPQAACVLRKTGDRLVIDGVKPGGETTLNVSGKDQDLGAVSLEHAGRFSIPFASPADDHGLVFLRLETTGSSQATDYPVFLTRISQGAAE